jgi:hypothetical protein
MKDTIILWTPDPPEGYGAFSGWEEAEEELNQITKDYGSDTEV